MSNQAQRRASGLVTPGGGQPEVNAELLAALQSAQPSKEEQARIAGVQIATQLHSGSMFRYVAHFLEGADAIGRYLFTGQLHSSAPVTDGGQ